MPKHIHIYSPWQKGGLQSFKLTCIKLSEELRTQVTHFNSIWAHKMAKSKSQKSDKN